MKLIAEYELKEPRIPRDYFVLLQSSLKKALCLYDKAYFEELYSQNTSKDFSFCTYLNKPSFQHDSIILQDNKLRVTYSMYGRELFLVFYNSLFKQKFKEFNLPNGNSMKLISLSMQQEPIITDSIVNVKMLSPLLVRAHNKETNKDIYLDFTHSDFESTLKTSIKQQSFKSLKKDYTEDLCITPIRPFKTVVMTRGEKLNANLGTYRIIGNPVLIDYLLQSGAGSKKSQGFGMMTLIGQGGET